MKNLLNFNQLSVISRDWTENGPKTDREWTENRPTRLRVLAKCAAMLLILLTLGVGQMWAENFPNGGKIFLKVNSNWKSDGARFAAYFYGNGDTWVSMTNVTGDYYVCNAPNGYPNVIFCRMNGGNNKNNWGNKWNQTGDLSYTSGKNLFTLPSDAWDGSTSTWGTYQLTSTGSVSASSTSITTAQSSTLTPSLTSNTTYNEIKSTSYSVSTNPGSAGSVTSGGVFSATAAGTYTVTATITYNAKGFSGITKTVSPTVSITVSVPAETTHSVTITYKCGATTVSTGTSQTIGEVTASSVTAPSVTGYTFSNWTLGAGISNQSANTSANPISVKTNNSGSGYTMQANYTLNSHTVTFNAMSGSGSMSAESFNYNQTKALTTNAYTRSGYVFKGWATSSANATAGTVAYADGADYTMGDANVTLYAVWYKKAYFVNVPKWTAANVMAHVYKDATSWKTWNTSDEKMTSTGTTVFGYAIYSYEFPDKYTTVKFHNAGANETDAWTWSSSTPYYYHGAGTQYASVDAIRQAWKVYGSWNQTAGVWNSNNFASYGTNTATYTVSLAASTTYSFKYVFAGTNTWYGQTGTGNIPDGTTWTLNGDNDVNFTSTVAGTYTFTINYSGMSSNSAPDCTVDFPVSYTVNFGVTPAAAADAPTNNLSISSGSLVASGTSITFTKDATPNSGYTWSHWEKNSSNVGSNNTYTTSITANTTVNAVYTEDMHTVTVTADSHGSVTTPASGTPRTVSAGITTGASIAASANTGYTFYNWTKTSGSGTVTFTNANANSTTVKATSDATVRANFVDKWTIKGSGTELGNWGTYNSMTPTGNTDEYSVTVALAASTTYDFKVVNRVDGGGDGTFYGKSSTTFTREGTKTVTGLVTTSGDTYNMHLTTDIAGNYTFTFLYNASTSSMKVTIGFPTAYKLTYGVGTIKGNNGSISTSPTTASGSYVASGNTVSLTGPAAKSGYTWKGWYTNAAGTTGNIADVDRAITVTMNATKTLYACYNYATYTATLSTTDRTGYDSGAPANQTATYLQNMPTITPPTAANGYCFMGYWDDEEGEGTQYYNADGTSAHAWDKTSGATLYAYFKQAEITAITFDAAVVEASRTVSFAVTVSPTPVGDTKTCFTILYSNDNPLSPQPTVTYNGSTGKYSFTAPAASGTYKVEAVLRTGSSCAGGTELDTEVATFSVAGLHTVTVRYKCGDETIKASTTVTGRPLDWSSAINPPTIFGYTFSSWEAGDGVTISTNGSSAIGGNTTTTPTIYIKAIYDGTLTANYTQNNYIYFKDNLGWTNPNDANAHVYLNLYTADYWTTNKGSGNNGVTNRNLQMDRVPGTTNIFYYNYGNKTTSRYVSFTKESMATYENFYQTSPAVAHVVFPTRSSDALGTDKATGLGFYSKTPMFVPQAIAEADGKLQNDSRARYYNDGYWTKYTPGTGYTLQVYYEDGSTSKGDYVFTSEDELMPMKAVVDLEAGRNYKFQLKRDGDVTYGNTGTMTYANHGQSVAWEYNQGVGKTTITTNAAGEYVFTLSYAANASQYRLRISVDYPIASGDYRVIYKDGVQTRYKASAIIPKVNNGKDTVSFFIRPGNASKDMKIQQATVNESTGAITWSSGTAITSSLSSLTKDSVYNICLTMNGSGAISVEKVEPYTGNYYIRTDAANSKWDNYRSDPDHLMTYSEYSITHGGYSHYYCHWVQTDDRKNVKFCIANDYSPSISDTLTRETASGTWTNIATFIDSNGDIKRNANVRFMWNRHDNTIARAYVDGAQENGSRFLVISSTDGKIKKSDGSALSNNEVTFSDKENWIYEANVKAQPKAAYKLISTWGTGTVITQYFKGTSGSTETLIDGSGTDWYDIRLLYDFKTNRLVAAWVPSDATITVNNAINADVMFIREHQGDIAQLTFSASGKISKIETAYGVIRFNKWTLANKEKTGGHSPLGTPASVYERSLFWISFPFRVKLSEVFGFGTYGTHWAIQRYDGAKRAEIGHFAENGSFWRWMDRNTEYLEPNQGYLLAIDLDLLGVSSDVWGPKSKSSQIELYFPSYGRMPDISDANVSQTIEEHTCTINWAETKGLPDTGDPRTSYNRTVFDSHWNVISVPTYVNTSNVTFANTAWTTAGDGKIGPRFLYTWNASDNTISATTASGYTYHAMHAYMTQYAGGITWSAKSGSPASIVARKTYAETPKEVEFRLELQQNEQEIDRTFVVLSNDEEVSADFQFGEDMTKEFNAKKSAIYTFIADEAVAAGNTLPMSEQTTVVPVGVDIKADGDYTFAMPDGTSGVGVVLIDNETGIRTSLSALDYTVFLEAGTYDKRFMMEISPIKQGTTGIDLINGDASANGVRKLLIDQKMYIIKGDKMYDATGRRVE